MSAPVAADPVSAAPVSAEPVSAEPGPTSPPPADPDPEVAGDPPITRLASDHGTTTIAESVVARIAARAAAEVEGVSSLGVESGAIRGVVRRIRGDEFSHPGLGVEVGTRQAAVDLTLTVEYPAPIHETAADVRRTVIDRLESMTGLEVVEVNIVVSDLAIEPSGPADRSRVR